MTKTQTFKRMKAYYNGTCANCGERLRRGEEIYYCRPHAYCTGCGEAKFEPHLTQGTLPILAVPAPKAEDTASTAPVQIVAVQPLTNQKCYCKLVKRKCGSCVAADLAAKKIQ